jgi:hypothetical protein
MRSYRCYYLMKGDEPSPLMPFIQLKADDAMPPRGSQCGPPAAHVTDVQRVQD